MSVACVEEPDVIDVDGPDAMNTAEPEPPPPLVTPWPQTESLRQVAERVAQVLPGYRIEIHGGSLVVSPTPTKKHNGIAVRIQRQLWEQLPKDRTALPVASVEAGDGSQSFCSPDLIVVPAEEDYEEGWLYEASIVDFALEVVSPSNPETDTRTKVLTYAEWGIPLYLIVDPRDATLALYFTPEQGEYRSVTSLKFGDVVELPAPLEGVRIETGDFARYETKKTEKKAAGTTKRKKKA